MIRSTSKDYVLNRIAVACIGLLLTGAAGSVAEAAAPVCPEGRTASGDCVNPSLAINARRAAIIFSQPKLSVTALPILPSLDPLYRYPYGLIPNPQQPSPIGPFRVIFDGGPIVVPAQ
jgi:hypothetical protein